MPFFDEALEKVKESATESIEDVESEARQRAEDERQKAEDEYLNKAEEVAKESGIISQEEFMRMTPAQRRAAIQRLTRTIDPSRWVLHLPIH